MEDLVPILRKAAELPSDHQDTLLRAAREIERLRGIVCRYVNETDAKNRLDDQVYIREVHEVGSISN